MTHHTEQHVPNRPSSVPIPDYAESYLLLKATLEELYSALSIHDFETTRQLEQKFQSLIVQFAAGVHQASMDFLAKNKGN